MRNFYVNIAIHKNFFQLQLHLRNVLSVMQVAHDELLQLAQGFEIAQAFVGDVFTLRNFNDLQRILAQSHFLQSLIGYIYTVDQCDPVELLTALNMRESIVANTGI